MNNLDPLSAELSEAYNPGIEHVFNSLDGDVYSQGIKLGHRAWLDMGSEDWQKAPDEMKAAAYQVAVKVGSWEELQLRELMLRRYRHLTSAVMDLTIETLREYAQKHPLHLEDVNVRKADVIISRHTPKPPELNISE